ncbi:MAG: nuclear transport factor 2 family protein [Acidobacteriia bacterium]|nr:nuclear transport factor 2 family protein [Terriglobia bacterium]
MMRRSALVCLLTLASAGLMPATDAEIQAAEKAWAGAVVRQDFAALEKIYSPKLIYAHSTGNVESKKEYMDRLRGGAQKYAVVDHQKMTIRLHGDTAVAHCHMRMTGVSNGKPFDDRLMLLHVWVKREGRWQLAAHQTTKLP